MLEELLLAALCLLVALVGLAIAAWEVISGRAFDIDGLWFTLISLTLAGVFGGALAGSLYTGGVLPMLRQLWKSSASNESPDKSQPNPR